MSQQFQVSKNWPQLPLHTQGLVINCMEQMRLRPERSPASEEGWVQGLSSERTTPLQTCRCEDPMAGKTNLSTEARPCWEPPPAHTWAQPLVTKFLLIGKEGLLMAASLEEGAACSFGQPPWSMCSLHNCP